MKVHTLDIDSGERDPVSYPNPSDYIVNLKKTQKYNIPVIITKEIVENILYERHYIRYLKINNIPKV